MAVKNQWNGMVEWNTGMEYWNDFNITQIPPSFYTMHQLHASDLFHPITS